MGETRDIKSTSENNKEGKGKNKLIFFLSKYKFDPKECHYKSKYDGGNNEIYGKQTPDAPTKYFLNYLTEKGKKIDDILCITSKDTNERKKNRNKPDKEYESAFENYQRVLNEFCEKKKIEVPKLIKLNFDYNFEKGESIDEDERYRNLFKSIVDEISENDTVYIDDTSGIRDTSLLIILMIRYLEYTGIKCGGMIYSYFDNDDKENNKIIDIKSTYDLFELLNGVNEFTSFGKSKTLSNYYNNIWKDKEEYKEISELIETMNDFSDMMSLCMVEDIDEIMKKLNQKIIEAEKIKNKINSNENQLMNYMFFNLIKEIKKKFYLEDGEEITYINLIRWCLDNDLIQQALTLYVEKMPEYYFNSNFFNINDENLNETLESLKILKDNYIDVFYKGIFKNILNDTKKYILTEEDIKELKSVKNKIIKKIKESIFKNKEYILGKENTSTQEYKEIYIKETLDEIKSIISREYKKGNTNKKIKIYSLDEDKPKDKEGFLSLLFSKEEIISEIVDNIYLKKKLKKIGTLSTKKNDIEYTYNKKINSIIILSTNNKNMPSWSNIRLKDLILLMEDYLYFKIMRNQINHAKKSKLTQEVESYLNKKYKSNIDAGYIKQKMYISINNIPEVLQRIEYSKEIASTV